MALFGYFLAHLELGIIPHLGRPFSLFSKDAQIKRRGMPTAFWHAKKLLNEIRGPKIGNGQIKNAGSPGFLRLIATYVETLAVFKVVSPIAKIKERLPVSY